MAEVLPFGTIVHDLPGRTRFRVPDRRHDRPFFAALQRDLSAIDGIISVTANESTGSVLVLHELTAAEVAGRAEKASLFALGEPEPAAKARKPPSQSVQDRLDDLDRALQRATDGAMDLEQTAFVALCAGAALQAVRGQFLPPGGTLLSFAAQYLLRSRTPPQANDEA